MAAEGITAAGHKLADADRIIEAGRAVHQDTGPLSEPAVNPNNEEGVIGYRRTDASPQVDERPLHIALEHVHTSLGAVRPDDNDPGSERSGDEQAAA